MLNKLGKLLKYEFRFYFRLLPPLYLVLALLALPAGFQMKQSGVHGVLLTSIWGITLTAMLVMNIVLVIQRFTDNFLRNPGSLMFTLPVTSWALTASKAIAALCIVLTSIIVVSASGVIYTIGLEGWSRILFNIQIGPIDGIIFAFVGIIMIFQQICLIYTAISASHILPRFRFAAGAVMYFAIMYFVEQPVFRFLMQRGGQHGHFIFPGSLLFLIPYGIAGLVFAAIFFWATGFLLKHSFNLE